MSTPLRSLRLLRQCEKNNEHELADSHRDELYSMVNRIRSTNFERSKHIINGRAIVFVEYFDLTDVSISGFTNIIGGTQIKYLAKIFPNENHKQRWSARTGQISLGSYEIHRMMGSVVWHIDAYHLDSENASISIGTHTTIDIFDHEPDYWTFKEHALNFLQ